MKSAKKHTLSLYRYLALLSGIVLCSIALLGTDSDENGFLHPDSLETEYSLIHGDQNSADEDSNTLMTSFFNH